MPRRIKTAAPSEADDRFELRLPAELLSAAKVHAERQRTTVGALCRQGLADAIGRPELGPTRPRGRQKSA